MYRPSVDLTDPRPGIQSSPDVYLKKIFVCSVAD